jgi:hypothetical protein
MHVLGQQSSSQHGVAALAGLSQACPWSPNENLNTRQNGQKLHTYYLLDSNH